MLREPWLFSESRLFQDHLPLCLSESSLEKERETPSPIDPNCVEVDVNFNPDPADLVLSSVPGGELFNPRKHKFAEEDLKPQPMIKKAKKVFVPDEQKVTWYICSSEGAAWAQGSGAFPNFHSVSPGGPTLLGDTSRKACIQSFGPHPAPVERKAFGWRLAPA